jgi:hypothetical protein
MVMSTDPEIPRPESLPNGPDHVVAEARLRSEVQAADAAILVLRTILGDHHRDHAMIVVEHGGTAARLPRAAAAQHLASLAAPYALHGRIEDGNLTIRVSPPTDDMLRFLAWRAERNKIENNDRGLVPTRCLRPHQQIQIIGIDTLTISTEAYIHFESNYIISPNYSLSGHEPAGGIDGPPSICWLIRVDGGGIGIKIGRD